MTSDTPTADPTTRERQPSAELLHLSEQVATLGREVAGLKAALNKTTAPERGWRPGAIRKSRAAKNPQSEALVPVQTFAPEPYDLLKPLLVSVQPGGDEFTACFPDANLTAYGDNEAEAVDNLKLLILDTLDNLGRPGRKLGPVPAGQLAVIREFVAKRG